MRRLVPVLVATLLVAFAPCLAGAALEGDWLLVEQSYGGGRANLPVGDEGRLTLEVRREGGVLTARVRAGEEKSAATPRAWPAWSTGDGPLPLELIGGAAAVTAEGLHARYHVWPSANRDLRLEVVERYRLEGDVLVGTVRVAFERDGEPRGSYLLHRRFERAP